jgi:DNA repair protein RecN (Recombination protein N)
MLHKLTIKNYAIIEQLEIAFSDRMNIITGETGAGKSILLGALSLILGDRADTKVLYDKDEKCVVEADFEIENKDLKSFFEANELDFETHTIVRREINQSGKSRAFVNDTPVTLNILKELGEKLMNLHNQHETLDLIKAGFQLQVIDVLARNKALLADYRLKFQVYKKGLARLNELTELAKSSSAEMDYLHFQLKELAEAKLEAGEQDELEKEQGTLANVEEIKVAVQSAIQILTNDEVSALGQLIEVQSRLRPVKSFNKDILALSERLQSVYEELKDISNELESVQDVTSLDPEKLELINARLSVIYRLQKKHNVISLDEVLKIQKDLEGKISSVEVNSTEIEVLAKQLDKQFKELCSIADQLHAAREKVLRDFQTHVVVLLAKVGMQNAVFKVDIRKLESRQLNENGLTDLRFLFSANKGFAPHEIKDVASGGELSRLMLCIKSLVADADALPTMIFDEIDAGISGEVALKVGEIMKKLSRNHQLICITHLPQIARTGDMHLYIYKETKDNRTQTRMKELKGEERIIEIAKMLSGNKLSEASLANARELIAS